MEKVNRIQSGIIPLQIDNVDTDQIIPARFLKATDKIGFGKNLFYDWRYNSNGHPNPDFILNKPKYRKATVLLAHDNFGCGSSREHAPWALLDYGFRVIIAPSFADIFYNNCVKNGILLVRLESGQVDELFELTQKNPGAQITADLENQIVTGAGHKTYSFEIEAFAKTCLLQGLDQIGWTQQFEDKIVLFESKSKQERPWLV